MVIFAQILSKQALKDTIFLKIHKRAKNGQMAKPCYFWQTVSKKAKYGRFGLFKGQICLIWPFLKLFARKEMVWPFGLFLAFFEC